MILVIQIHISNIYKLERTLFCDGALLYNRKNLSFFILIKKIFVSTK